MIQLTLHDCLNTRTIEFSALTFINKIAFNPRKGYTSANNETFWDFAGKLKRNITKIIDQIHSHTYKYDPCLKKTRIVHGRERDLYISTWSDKIVERWLNDCLNLLLNKWFSKNSYAYRINALGLDSCQTKIVHALTTNDYIIKRDISSYFYTINHDILISQIKNLIDPTDFLYELLLNRINFLYHTGNNNVLTATIGIPFGSSLACTLSNIHLTPLDKKMAEMPINYFRYADDFLITANDPNIAIIAAETLDNELTSLKLTSKKTHQFNISFKNHHQFKTVNKFKHLGLEYTSDKIIRLPVEKQRKILNFYKNEMERIKPRLSRLPIQDRLNIAVKEANNIIIKRIRAVAIIDYYLKHVTDDIQLKLLDLEIATIIISTILNKKFRYHDFSKISFKSLRNAGLISLRHRQKLHRHGHLKVSFLSIHNELIADRYESMLRQRRDRINHMRINKKLRKIK